MTDKPSNAIFEGNKQGVVTSNGRNETTLDTQDGNAIPLQQKIIAEKPNGITPQGQHQTTAGKILGHPAALDAILAKIKLVAEKAKKQAEIARQEEEAKRIRAEIARQEEEVKQAEMARQKEEEKTEIEEGKETKLVEQAEQEEKDNEKAKKEKMAKQTEQERASKTSINWGDKLSDDEKATMVSIKEINNSRIVTDPNILHEIARRGSEFEDYHSFVKWLLGRKRLSSILLQQKSKLYHRRPLQLALENENSDFVKTILDNFKERTSSEKGDNGDNLTLATLLRPESPKAFESNCIHLAIGARSPHTINIIEACEGSHEIFMQRDSEKRQETPLHLAVVCGVTAQSQSPNDDKFNALDVVEKLIERCPDALYAINVDGETPYRSRIRALANKATAGGASVAQANLQGQNGKQQFGGINVHDEMDTVIKTYYDDIADMDTVIKTYYDDLADNPREETGNTTQQNTTSNEKHATSNEEDPVSKEEDQNLRKEVIDDPILCAIREHCVKNMHRFELIKALYQGAQQRETYFDLSTLLNTEISQSYLDALEHINFESILVYVALPRITFGDQSSKNRRGRWDMINVFEWLRKKGVKKILSVIVIDSIEPSHSDAAIEAALGTKVSRRSFDIETWDWKKLDLNCDVISRCAPNVKEISLYCSGNNAVLMGWSSTSGLCDKEKFPKLEKVKLTYQEGLEEDDRLSTYVNEFARSVSSSFAKEGRSMTVRAMADKKDKSYLGGFEKENGADKPAERQHKWLDNSDNFRKILNSIDDQATEVRPIKIAIIDNGVDVALSILSGKIANGASFFSQNTGNATHYYPYYVASDTRNHGSLVATLVCTMCPKVKLYICRLDEKVSPTGNRYITMESATKAVEWATDQKVDVICMSWTIEDNIKKADAQKKFRDALTIADSKDIIMVSSASDQGGNSMKTWPGESGTCIRIGASTETGDKSLHVHRGDMEFLFPGEEVPLGVNEEHLSMTTYDGSSIATAIAAGTAGLLLYLDRLAHKWGDAEYQINSEEEADIEEEDDIEGEGDIEEQGDNKNWDPLKGRIAMKKVFESMSTAGNKCPSLDRFNNFQETSFMELDTACARLRRILRSLKNGNRYFGPNQR